MLFALHSSRANVWHDSVIAITESCHIDAGVERSFWKIMAKEQASAEAFMFKYDSAIETGRVKVIFVASVCHGL